MKRERYFVRQLPPDERPSDGSAFEIQILNDCGQAIDCGYIHAYDDALTIGGREIPRRVVEAAK